MVCNRLVPARFESVPRTNLARGFSLLETLVAVAILSLAVIVAYRGAEGANRLSDERLVRAMALMCANNLLIERQLFASRGGDFGVTPCQQGGFRFDMRLSLRATPNINFVAVTASAALNGQVQTSITAIDKR